MAGIEAPLDVKLVENMSDEWYEYFADVSNDSEAIELNTIHRTSDGSDHTFIDQDVTTTSSPSFDGKDILKWAVLQGG